MSFGLFYTIFTVVMFVVFIGIIVWAWSAKRKRGFDEAARMPLDDDDAPPARPFGDKPHG